MPFPSPGFTTGAPILGVLGPHPCGPHPCRALVEGDPSSLLPSGTCRSPSTSEKELGREQALGRSPELYSRQYMKSMQMPCKNSMQISTASTYSSSVPHLNPRVPGSFRPRRGRLSYSPHLTACGALSAPPPPPITPAQPFLILTLPHPPPDLW